MKILECCDAVFTLPNWTDSEGAKAEVEKAKKLGKPIISSIEDLPDRRKGI